MNSSIVPADLPKHLDLLLETAKLSKAAEASIAKVKEVTASEKDVPASLGLGLLELKNQLMLQYLIDLTHVQMIKCSGGVLSGNASVDRLVSVRTVLEKLRPLEDKLKHQVDRAIKVADSGGIDASDPMLAKTDPKAILSKFDGDDDGSGGSGGSEDQDDEDDGVSSEKTGKYVVPKHIPTYYPDPAEEAASAAAAVATSVAGSKKHALSRSLIDELRHEHLDTPEEIHEHDDVLKKRKIKAMQERIRYEEDNFVRLPITKKQKHSRRQLSTMGRLADEITSFGQSYFSEPAGKAAKRRKDSSKKSSKKKKFRRQ